MQRLSRGGFKKDFVQPAILPDWWDETCAEDSRLLSDVEIRVARFLGVPLEAVRDAAGALRPPAYPNAQLRRVKDLDRDRLGPAIHSALRVAAATVRQLIDEVPATSLPPVDGLEWRSLIPRSRKALTLEDIVGDLWGRGIPVIPLEVLPSPSPQGIACIVDGRPVILLGHKYDEPGRVAFLLAHETGHIAVGDCAPGQPVVDEEEGVVDDSEMERRADSYARRLLLGDSQLASLDAGNFKQLANAAVAMERTTGADASLIIFSWAAQTHDYAKATMAVKAIYRSSGARRVLRRFFDQHVDVESASESDRSLLRCVFGDPG